MPNLGRTHNTCFHGILIEIYSSIPCRQLHTTRYKEIMVCEIAAYRTEQGSYTSSHFLLYDRIHFQSRF